MILVIKGKKSKWKRDEEKKEVEKKSKNLIIYESKSFCQHLFKKFCIWKTFLSLYILTLTYRAQTGNVLYVIFNNVGVG